MKSVLEAESYGGGSVCAMQSVRRPPWLPERVWPFGSRRLEVDGAGVAVTDVGEGPALLFVHTGMWSFIWRDVMTRLLGDFRCVCFDSPGTGQSDRLPPSGISLERASRAVTAVIEALDLRNLTLVVHDLGGPAGIAGAAPSAAAGSRSGRGQHLRVEAVGRDISRHARPDGQRADARVRCSERDARPRLREQLRRRTPS